jgi:D-amino-acid dehydrogenase
MKTLVLGAGLIGATTAYYLARHGHQVTVVERQDGPGLETSFANGGMVTPSMSDPWASPGLPLMMLKWLGREDAPFLMRPAALPGVAAWGLRFLINCRTKRWHDNARAILRLTSYSRDALDALSAESDIAYDRLAVGTLKLFRDPPSMAAARRAAALLGELGVAHENLDAAACVALEPALAPIEERIAGAIHFPDDRSGDAHKFTAEVARLAAGLGVEFRYGVTVRAIESAGGRVGGIATDQGRLEADAYVLALGSYSPRIARPLGIRLPIYPVKGYSITVPTGGWNEAPTVPVADNARKIAVVRLGERLRIAGTAEFAGYDTGLNRRRGEMLVKALGDLYPAFPTPPPEHIEHWCGLRPMTPDDRPIMGRSPYANLWLNTGQGHLGWTMACGSGRVVADLVAGHEPEIDLEGLTLERFQALPG